MSKNFWNKMSLRVNSVTAVTVLVIIYLLKATPSMNDDASSYIVFSPMRPPLYPVFIWLFHWFGKYQMIFIMWLQSVIYLLSLLLIFEKWLQGRFSVSSLISFLVVLVATVVIFFHLGVFGKIDAESLAFPLFIMAFYFIVECFIKFDIKKIIYLSIFTTLLLLTRLQFYYFYFLFVILFSWYIYKKNSLRNIILYSSIVCLSIFATDFISRMYQEKLYGNSQHIAPTSGLEIIVQAMYLASASDVKYFKEPKKKQLFLKAIKQLENQNLTMKTSPSIFLSSQGISVASYYYYSLMFNDIMIVATENIAGSSLLNMVPAKYGYLAIWPNGTMINSFYKDAINIVNRPDNTNLVDLYWYSNNETILNKTLSITELPGILIPKKQLFLISGFQSYNVVSKIMSMCGIDYKPLDPEIINEIYSGNSAMLEISKTLIVHKWKDHMRFFMIKLIYVFGGIPQLLCFLLMTAAICFHTIRDKCSDPFNIFFSVALITISLNAFTISVSADELQRYYIYSYFLLFSLTGLVVNKFFKKRTD